MLHHQTEQQYLELAKTAKRAIIFREVVADYLTPVSIFAAMRDEMRGGALLESGSKDIGTGRYSFLGFDLMAQLHITQNKAIQKIGDSTTQIHAEPLAALRQFMENTASKSNHAIPGFTGGTVGYITYDAIRLFEKIPDRHHAEAELADMAFNCYRKTITFDHQEQKIIIALVVDSSAQAQQDYANAHQAIDQIIKKINNFNFSTIGTNDNVNERPDISVHTDTSDEQFQALVGQAKEYINKGDAFQIVLSRTFKLPVNASPFDVYRGLRHVSPAPYMFYLDLEDAVIVGASPEKLISLQQGQVTINPIAGTRARKSLEEDASIANELLSDKKEIAEHMMLVDLARNDIGTICKPGSVKILELMQAKYYSHIIHLTSLVSGELKEGYDAFDVLKAGFPAGTLTGAPKIRSMEIIDELENSRRGLYGGGICCIDSQGNLDSCIAIRHALLKNGMAKLQAGAGVVYDSQPEAEAAETRHKVKSIIEGIIFAEQYFK
jgi:anthranilate synthase component 1